MARAISLGMALLLLAVGCAPKIQEKDLYGDWKVDNASLPNTAQTQNIKDAVLNLAFDHRFRMLLSQSMSLKGDWSFDDRKVSITPQTLVVGMPNGPLELRLTDAADKLGPLLSETPEGKKELEALKSASQPWSLRLSNDGKKLTTNDNAVWVKQQASSSTS
jgi:hypothetical protein